MSVCAYHSQLAFVFVFVFFLIFFLYLCVLALMFVLWDSWALASTFICAFVLAFICFFVCVCMHEIDVINIIV